MKDGDEAARMRRTQDGGERLLLAAITGAPGWETATQAREVGFNAFFGRPMDGRDIESLLYGQHKGDKSEWGDGVARPRLLRRRDARSPNLSVCTQFRAVS